MYPAETRSPPGTRLPFLSVSATQHDVFPNSRFVCRLQNALPPRKRIGIGLEFFCIGGQNGTMKSRWVRYSLLATILGLVVYLALGNGFRTFEAFCPFGGVESLWGLFTNGQYACALGALNLSILLAVLALVLIAKKAFCSWACPVGFIGELLARLGGRVWRRRPKVPTVWNDRLKLLRYVVLVLALVFTAKTSELVLRGFDPYFLIFSGFGHGSSGWISVVVLGLTMVGMFLVPMFFCRYLCPLGAVFDPLSRIGWMRIRREAAHCNGCGRCDRACLHAIPVQKLTTITHRDCTNCLECVDACDAPGPALGISFGPVRGGAVAGTVPESLPAGASFRIPRFVLPLLVVAALFGGYEMRTAFARPTTVHTFAPGTGSMAAFVVEGVKCHGTANLFSSLYEDTPGILKIETTASERTAVFTYDPKVITIDDIRAIMDAPIPFEDGSTSKVFTCLSVEPR